MKTENIRARLEMQESGLDHQMYGIKDVMPLDVDTIMAIVEDEAVKRPTFIIKANGDIIPVEPGNKLQRCGSCAYEDDLK